jgi:hypothetical protein
MIDKESKEKFDLLKEIREQKEKFDLLKEIREQEEQEIIEKFEEQEIIEKFQNYIRILYGNSRNVFFHRFKDRFEDFKKRLENGEDYDDIIRKARILRSLELLIYATYIACVIFCGPAYNFLEKILVFTTICLIFLFWNIKY